MKNPVTTSKLENCVAAIKSLSTFQWIAIVVVMVVVVLGTLSWVSIIQASKQQKQSNYLRDMKVQALRDHTTTMEMMDRWDKHTEKLVSSRSPMKSTPKLFGPKLVLPVVSSFEDKVFKQIGAFVDRTNMREHRAYYNSNSGFRAFKCEFNTALDSRRTQNAIMVLALCEASDYMLEVFEENGVTPEEMGFAL